MVGTGGFYLHVTTVAKLPDLGTWIELHRDELMADWTLAVNGQPVFKIDPPR